MKFRSAVAGSALVAAALVGSQAKPTVAQSTTPTPEATQKIDEKYTQIIRQNLQDPRITTELVDHLPASDTVPTPLKFFGRAVGRPSELTYAKDIHRYFEALAKASPRAKYLKIGGSAQSQVNGLAKTGNAPLPYQKTDATPNLAYLDSSDDIRGGMGIEGLLELAKFVQAGGTLAVRQGTRRDVRAAAVLALADAGDVLPRLQCDLELERSGCREGVGEQFTIYN